MQYKFNCISEHPVLKESKGVYCIQAVNGFEYIGSTCVSFKDRWRSHLSALKLNKHHSKHMQNCYNKYGVDYFSLSILYYGDGKEDILECEQHYIDTLKPKFNTSLTVGYYADGFKQSEKFVEQNRAKGREKALKEDKGVRLNRNNKYEVYVRLKNHVINVGGFLTEEEAKLKQKEIRNYFWSEEFENKNIVDQDEEVALFKLQHKLKLKTERDTSGAVFDSNQNKYRARLYVEGKVVNFGSFVLKEDAEKAYSEGRTIFVSEDFVLLSKEEKEKFIEDFRFKHRSKINNSSGHAFIVFSRNRFIFKYKNKHHKTFRTSEQASYYRDQYLENLKALHQT